MVNKKQNGFSIIEVVLVLAIAGLIFLMVFIALPALQRGQRDTQRRQDITRFMGQIKQYSSNNNGNVPAGNSTAMTSFLNSYMKASNGEFKDPQTGATYTVSFGTGGTATTSNLVYATAAECNGENIVAKSGANRAVAVKIQLEGSGFYCQDNQ